MRWWEHCVLWGGVALNLGSAWVNYRSIRAVRAIEAHEPRKPRKDHRPLEGPQRRMRPVVGIDPPPAPWRRSDEW
jgi:hypothetical protein